MDRPVHFPESMLRSGRSLMLFVVLAALAGAGRADVFRVLDDPGEAAQARVDVIQQARTEINALYFLARNDRVTLTALALLREARRRGVGEVRLIVDANFHRIPKDLLAHLREEGVQIRVYHPLTLRHPSWIFRRMHEKVVVVDGERYITGGRNLAEAYFGLAKKNYVDRDVYVEGPSAADADRHFKKVWSSRHVTDLSVRVSAREKRRAAQRLDDLLRDLECGGFVTLNTRRDWSEGQKEVDSVRFLHDPLVSENGTRVGQQLSELIEQAKTTVVIESPYLIPSRSMIELIERKLRDGVYVLILTNSLRSTDGVLPHAGYVKYRRRLVRAGVDVREYKGPDMLHAKSAVIDGKIVLVGSYNLDPRSQNLNTEVMCVVTDEDIGREVLDSIDLHIRNAWQVHRTGMLFRRERDPVASRAKSFGAWAARLLLPLIERQL
jgi:putative cardiolipin synthase